jgi:Domain of Unknown Function (DUF1080)
MIRSLIQKSGISFLLLSLVSCANLEGPSGNQWTVLFDSNSNLNQYKQVGNANWRIEEGILKADLLSSKDPSYLVHKNKLKDFQIYAEFWADAQTNSGVFIRCTNPEKINAVDCYEVNIWDTRPDPSYGTGAIVDVAKLKTPYPHAGGKWNIMEITAKGDLLIVKLNGEETVNTRNSRLKEGFVAVQFGSGIIKFRKLLAKEIN